MEDSQSKETVWKENYKQVAFDRIPTFPNLYGKRDS